MKQYPIKYIDSNLLFVLWKLLSMPNMSGLKSKHGKEFLPLLTLPHCVKPKLDENECASYLVKLCDNYGVIKRMYIDILDSSYTETKTPIDSSYFEFHESQGLTDNDIPADDLLIGHPIEDYKKERMEYHVEIDWPAAQDFLNQYLKKWYQDELKSKTHNLLRAPLQLKKVVEHIFYLLKDHSNKNLAVSEITLHNDVDFMASILFLEKYSCIELHHIKVLTDELWTSRADFVAEITTNNRIYDDFPTQSDLYEARYKVPEEIKIKILEVLYSFESGNPSQDDLKYIDYQKQHDQHMRTAHNELYVDWLHYILTNNHHLRIDYKIFNDFLRSLWFENLIRAPFVDESDLKLKSILLSKKRNFDSFWILISEEGIHYLKKRKVGPSVPYIQSQDSNKLPVEKKSITYKNYALFYGMTTIPKLSEMQGRICEAIFSKPVGSIYKTIDLEEIAYSSEATKQRQENFKKLIARLNKIIDKEFGIKRGIRYGMNSIQRLV